MNEWGVAPSSPAKPVYGRQASHNAHDMANYFATALKGQQGAHIQNLQKNAQLQRQQLAAELMQQQHLLPPQTYAQPMPKNSHKRDNRASVSPHVQGGNTTVAASGGQGNDQGWGGSGWGTNWNGTAGEEGWGSGNAWASSQNAQTNWDTLNNANYSGANSTKPLPDSANSVQKKLPQSPAMAHSQSWGGWNMPAHGQEYVGKSNDNIPALVVTSPTTNPAGSVKSAKRRKKHTRQHLIPCFHKSENRSQRKGLQTKAQH